MTEPAAIRAEELPAVREQIRVRIAVAAAGFTPSPIDDLPDWVDGIVRAVTFQIRLDHPDGVTDPARARSYIRRALNLFDNEYALHHFDLEPELGAF